MKKLIIALMMLTRMAYGQAFVELQWTNFLDNVNGDTTFKLQFNPLEVPEQMTLVSTNDGGTVTNTFTTVRYNTNTAWVIWADGSSNRLDEILGSTDVNIGFMRLTNIYTADLTAPTVPTNILTYWDDGGVSSGFILETNRLRWVRNYDLPAIVDVRTRMAPAVGSNKDLTLYLATNGVYITDAMITLTATAGNFLNFEIVFPVLFSSNTYLQVGVSYDNSPVQDVVIDEGGTVTIRR